MMKKKNKSDEVIREPEDAPPAWEEDDSTQTIQFDTSIKDPFVTVFANWRKFMMPLSKEERKFVKKLACGDKQGCSNEDINAVVSATKGTLDKVGK